MRSFWEDDEANPSETQSGLLSTYTLPPETEANIWCWGRAKGMNWTRNPRFLPDVGCRPCWRKLPPAGRLSIWLTGRGWSTVSGEQATLSHCPHGCYGCIQAGGRDCSWGAPEASTHVRLGWRWQECARGDPEYRASVLQCKTWGVRRPLSLGCASLPWDAAGVETPACLHHVPLPRHKEKPERKAPHPRYARSVCSPSTDKAELCVGYEGHVLPDPAPRLRRKVGWEMTGHKLTPCTTSLERSSAVCYIVKPHYVYEFSQDNFFACSQKDYYKNVRGIHSYKNELKYPSAEDWINKSLSCRQNTTQQ